MYNFVVILITCTDSNKSDFYLTKNTITNSVFYSKYINLTNLTKFYSSVVLHIYDANTPK